MTYLKITRLLVFVCTKSILMTATVWAEDINPSKHNPALKVQIGEKMPELTFGDVRGMPKGEKLTMETFRDKVVVLEFWGPFCTPCIGAFPHINKLKKVFEKKPVVFLSIADQAYSGCARILQNHKLDTWQVYDSGAPVFSAFGVSRMPRTIIIDRSGKIAAYTTPDKLDKKMIFAAIKDKPIKSNFSADDFVIEE